MGSVLLFIVAVPLLLLLFLAIRYRYHILSVYRMREQYKQAQQRASEEQERREKVRRHTHPEYSSVEMIQDASIDLEGGEYIDYEEVKEP